MKLSERLRAFVADHPGGWNHDDWMRLLGELQREGADVSQPATIGAKLERERLAWTLEGCSVRGLGPKRIAAIVDRFETLWALRRASPEDVAKVPSVPRSLAEKVLAAVR